jgi:4-oxalocrotonate tautomerase
MIRKKVPHVIVTLWAGKSEQQKTRLAEAITRDVMEILYYGDESFYVAFEEGEISRWAARFKCPTF